MRINHTTATSFVAPASGKPHSAPHRGGEDSVQLSHATRVAADPQRVMDLQAAVSAGTYRVPAHHVAASLIQETMLASGT